VEASGIGKAMRLAVVSPHFESFVRDQVHALATRGVDVVAFTLRPRWAVRDRLRSSVIGSGRELFVRQAIFRSPLLSTRWPAPLVRFSRAIPWLQNQLRSNRFDLVHAHFLYPPGVVASIAAARQGVPCIVTGHGFDVYRLPFRGASWRFRIREALQSSAAIITVSKRNASLLSRLGAVSDRVVVVPNGFDPEVFFPAPREQARQRLGLSLEEILIAAVGHLVPIKGFDLALRALACVKRPAHLLLLGRGPERKPLERLARSLGIADRVAFVGEVPPPVVAEYLRASDIVLISSRAEGNPTVLVEALGCGRPVVAFRVGGIPDILDSRAGILVEPEDVDSLARAVEEALARSWCEADIAAEASQWTWPSLAGRILGVYERALSRGPIVE